MSKGTSITNPQFCHQFVFRNGTSCSKNTKDSPIDGCPTSNLQVVAFDSDG